MFSICLSVNLTTLLLMPREMVSPCIGLYIGLYWTISIITAVIIL